MKKLFTILATLICLTSCGVTSHYSPYISLDRMENSGSRRQIMSEDYECDLDGAEYNFLIKVFDYGTYKDWILLVSSYYQIPDDAKLLIKLRNDEVITLNVDNVSVGEVDVTSSFGYKKIDHYAAVFPIYLSHFDKIAKFGIKKVRISTPYSYRDKTFIANLLGSHITTSKKHIDKRLATTRHKSIDEDF
ncbi:MAG: hypothetical protein E7113_05705 [Bacteroidales bacterium]|nr:hypothetical protein [Bacteroidales bacterium]